MPRGAAAGATNAPGSGANHAPGVAKRGLRNGGAWCRTTRLGGGHRAASDIRRPDRAPAFMRVIPCVAKPGTVARPAAGAHPTGDEMGRVAQRESTTLTS